MVDQDAVRKGDVGYLRLGAAGIPLHHLAASRVSLEQAFMELTADSVDFHAGIPASQSSAHNGMEA